mgnify:CR=1 FL=1
MNQTSQPAGGNIKKPAGRRRRGGLLNFILLIAIIGVIAGFVWAEQQRRAARTELAQTVTELEELRQASQRDGAEVAAEVLGKLRAHINVPETPEPTVATIVNIEQLRQANEFYTVADNGDHLIITEKRAILYDPDLDVILDVVPVTINAAEDTPPAEDEAAPEADPAAPAEGEEAPTEEVVPEG